MKLLFFILLDQTFKYLAVKRNFAKINQNIALGISLSWGRGYFLILTCLLVIFIFLFLLFAIKRHSGVVVPLKMILAGGLSNLIDRTFYKGVVDYIFLPLIPVFNLADLIIVVGVFLFFFKIFITQNE